MAKAGEAYGFLKYGGRIEDILDYIPAVRTSAQTPPELSLQVIEGAENLGTSSDSGLAELVELAKGANLNYVFRARLPNADNARAANELKDIVNQLYQTPLYQEGDEFCAEIAYRNGDKYTRLE